MTVEDVPMSEEKRREIDAKIEDLTLKLKAQPHRVDLVFGRASAYRDKGELQSAVDDFTRVLELEPGHRRSHTTKTKLSVGFAFNEDGTPSSYVLRGEAYRQLGREDEAIEDYTRALFIDPADVQSYVVRADSNLKQGFYKEAAADYTKALELQPASIPALLGRSQTFLKLKRYEDAHAEVNKALALEPGNPELVRQLASIHMAEGDIEEGRRLMKSLLPPPEEGKEGEAPVEDAQMLLMNAMLAAKQADASGEEGKGKEEAFENLAKVLALDPSSVGALYTRAGLNLAGGDLEASIEDCHACLEKVPDHADAMVVLGECLRLKGDLAAAVEYYTKALDNTSPLYDLDAAELYVVRGESYLKQKLYDPAIADFDAALELVPSHMHAHIERCEANRMLGRFEEAFKDYRAAVDNGYMHANGFLILAFLNYHKGDLETSLMNCNQALSLDPDFADVFSVRGFLHLLQHKELAAKNDLSKGLVMGAGNLPSAEVPQVVLSRDGYHKGVITFEQSLEEVPRHTYMYGLRTNQIQDTPAELVAKADATVRNMQVEYKLVDDAEVNTELDYIVNNEYLDDETKLRQLKALETKIHRRKAGEVREDLIDMWERLGLTDELRGQIWEEIKIALRKEEEGYPVDMELLERCRLECGRLQAIREAGLAEACTRFEEWGKQRERCEQAWDELGTPLEERKLYPYPGWEMMDADVVGLTSQAEALKQLVLEKRERDGQVEGANQCDMINTLLHMHNECSVLRTLIGRDKHVKDDLRNLGTNVREVTAAMAKEKARLTKIHLERQRQLFDLIERAQKAFELLATKPPEMCALFKHEHRSVTTQSLQDLQRRVEYLEFKCSVPKAKEVVKGYQEKLKRAKANVKNEKDKAAKKDLKELVDAAKEELSAHKTAWVEAKKKVAEQKGSTQDKDLMNLLKKKNYKKEIKILRDKEYPLFPEFDQTKLSKRPSSLVKWEQAEDPDKFIADQIESELARSQDLAAKSAPAQNVAMIDLDTHGHFGEVLNIMRALMENDRTPIWQQQQKPDPKQQGRRTPGTPNRR